jgi:hypothetical protein
VTGDQFAEDVVAEIRDILDIDEDETLVVQTPQFEREDGVEPGSPPLTADAMDRLTHADESDLQDLGLRKWSDKTGMWLLPYEWHPHLPPEYPLLNILGEWTSRSEMPATPGKRYGMLSVGIVPDFEKDDRDDGHVATDGGSRLRCSSCRATVTLDDTLGLKAPELPKDTIARIRVCTDCRPDIGGNKRPITAYKDLLEAVIKRANGVDEAQATLSEKGWEPEPATLRDGETADVDSHARRNAEQLRMAENDDDDVMTDGGEDEWLLDEETNIVTTPSTPYELSLNPGYETAPRNPLCPVCEDQIRPISNAVERRFVCGCEQIWQFTFDREEASDD